MLHFVTTPRVRGTLIVGAAALVVALLLLSHSFGRAVPTNNYRPLLPAAALSTGCYPLPGGAELTLSHQIRGDGDVETETGQRRTLKGQYNLVDRDEAERLVVEAFTGVGFTVDPDSPGHWVRLTNPDLGTVAVLVTELPGTSEETLVRGEFVLDLPVTAAAKDDPVCSDPKSTKRWGR